MSREASLATRLHFEAGRRWSTPPRITIDADQINIIGRLQNQYPLEYSYYRPRKQTRQFTVQVAILGFGTRLDDLDSTDLRQLYPLIADEEQFPLDGRIYVASPNLIVVGEVAASGGMTAEVNQVLLGAGVPLPKVGIDPQYR